jgi:hypothetical protein
MLPHRQGTSEQVILVARCEHAARHQDLRFRAEVSGLALEVHDASSMQTILKSTRHTRERFRCARCARRFMLDHHVVVFCLAQNGAGLLRLRRAGDGHKGQCHDGQEEGFRLA